jgi:hypothetical protein
LLAFQLSTPLARDALSRVLAGRAIRRRSAALADPAAQE